MNRLADIPNEYPIELAPPDIACHAAGTDGLRYVHSFRADAPGPHVAITAIVHGNEPCGAIALDTFLRAGLRPVRGTLSFAFVNVDAYERFDPANPNATRWVDEDLNRLWSDEILGGGRDSVELRRARELLPFIRSVDLLLDVHSMQHATTPLVLAGPAKKGAAFARRVGAPREIVVDSGHSAGPRMRDYGAFADPASDRNALLVECGQHWAQSSVAVAFDTAVRFLRATGAVPEDALAEHIRSADEPQRVIEVTDRVTIATDRFTFAAPFRGFEIIAAAGTVIGHDGDTPVLTPHDDCVLIMPSKRLWPGQTAVRLGRFVPP